MKNVSREIRALVLAAAFCVMVAPATVRAQAAGQHQHGCMHGDQCPAMQTGKMQMPGMTMEEMAARNKANTERITALMAQINAATGDARVAAMAELIGILVGERATMQQHCAAMHAMMRK